MITFLSRKNIEFKNQVDEFIKNKETKMKYTQKQIDGVLKLSEMVNSCCFHSLYRDTEIDTSYILSHQCKNKFCNVCNYIRQKKLRKKYRRFFEQNRILYHIENKKSGKRQYTTKKRYETIKSISIKLAEVEFDLMHLTLTLPHYKETGFNGDKYYHKKIIALFNDLRINKDFSEMVLGGEYGVETVNGKWVYYLADKETGEINEYSNKEYYDIKRSEKRNNYIVAETKESDKSDGLNIHIHSLLLVKKAYQNRSKLNRIIIKEWNRLTYNEFNKEGEFILKYNDELSVRKQLKKKRYTFLDLINQIEIIEKELNYDLSVDKNRLNNRIQGIIKSVLPNRFEISNKSFESEIKAKEFAENFALNLVAKSSTRIGLETIYTKNSEGQKVRTNTFGDDAMIKALMETISYHFEPGAFDKKNKVFDIDLIINLQQHTRNVRLYNRFGCLYYETSLSPNVKDLTEEYSENKEDQQKQSYTVSNHYILPASRLFHNPDQDNKIILSKKQKADSVLLANTDTNEAVIYMQNMIKAKYNKRVHKENEENFIVEMEEY